MDDFERQLRALPLARPPAGLEQRIFGEPRARWSIFANLRRQPVRLSWALGLAALMLAVGYLTGRLGGERSAEAPVQNEIVVRIIEPATAPVSFEFTSDAPGFLSGEVSTQVSSGGVI